jgi:lipoate-protein ligase A
MIEANTYNLPDYKILHSEQETVFHIWQPDNTYIVLGRSNRDLSQSVHTEQAQNDHVEIYKRPSGGEAVVLSPDMLVISVKLPLENTLKTHQYFRYINHAIIRALKRAGIKNLKEKGISDIAIGPKKILGSSIYRKSDAIFYHAVLNISEPVSTISRYLKHPSREPDYRNGRDHDEFVTSLSKEGYETDVSILKKLLHQSLNDLINKKAPEELLK